MYANRIAMTVLCCIVVIAVVTSIMSFAGVPETDYMPYIYFLVALLVLSIVLPALPLSLIG